MISDHFISDHLFLSVEHFLIDMSKVTDQVEELFLIIIKTEWLELYYFQTQLGCT